MSAVSIRSIAWIAVAWLLVPGTWTPVPARAEVPSPPSGAHTWTTRDGTEVDAVWGTVEVPENRDDPASRTLRLAYVRLPTTARRPGPPIVYLAGGPGASGIESARGPRASLLRELRGVADVILLDQRGTGSSRPAVVCRDAWRHAADEALESDEALRSVLEAADVCRARMEERGVPLSAYNLREIADDVDAVRRALGAERVSLVATSFGTRLALEVLRRHPDAVERAALLGVVGPDHVLKSPAAVDEVLDRIEAEDGASVADVLRRVLVDVERSPVEASAVDVLTGKPVVMQLGAFDLRRTMLRHLGDVAGLLHLRELAADMARGDFDPLAQEALRQRKSWLGHLMPYAVTCSAGASTERRREVAAQSPHTLFRRVLEFGFPQICDVLGVEPLGDSVRRPVRSEVPTLLVSGTLDARTPVRNAEEVLEGLLRGAHLVVEGAGHGDDLFVSTPEIAERVVAFFGGAEPRSGRVTARPPWRRTPPPPDTLVNVVTETLHGVEITDPYRWLEDSETPETRIWVRQQNRYTDRLLEVLPFRPELRRALEGLFAAQAVGRPRVRGDRVVYRRRDGRDRLPRVVVRDGAADERVLLDPEELDPDGGTDVDLLDLSSDGSLLAYSVQRDGAEEVAVRFLDIDEGPLDDELPEGRYFGVDVAPDGRGAYYARELDSGEGSRYYYHRFGTDPAEDPVIFGEEYGRASVVWGNVSDSGEYLVLHGVSGTQRRIDVFVDRIGSDDPVTGHDLSTRREVVRDVDASFFAGVLGGRLVIHTDWEAPRGRVFVAPVDRPGRENWREIVPQDDSAVIETVFGAGGRLLVETLEDVRSKVSIYDLEGHRHGELPLPASGSVLGFSGSWDDRIVYFGFSSFHLPSTVYRYDLRSGELSVWHERGGRDLDPEAFTMRRVWIPSKDGVEVPASVIHRRDVEIDGSRPTLVTAYGGFATSLTPTYSPEAALWVQRGGVYVVAHVRGGGELGSAWHEAAVRENKQRSIDDLLATLEWLIDEGYTRPERLAIRGHSNGGLLAAAAMTQKPHLMGAVVSTHPLLDMLRYNKFLAARFWLPEYGSPDRADAFPYLREYSPYQNVDDERTYPAVFLMTSYGDTQVAPLHARKMTARLQAVTKPDRPVVLRHYHHTGHGGEGVTTRHRVDELTDVLSFLYWQLGEAGDGDRAALPSGLPKAD